LDQETNSTLVLSNVALFQAGTYQAVVSNPYGSVTSAPAQLTVLLPATILSGPLDQLATNGDTVFVSVSAQGTAPLSYQWYFQGTGLAEGTGATLILSNVSPAQAGTYGVVVSNPYGTASNSMVLSVIVLPTIACGSNRTVELGSAWTFDVPVVTGSNTTLSVVSTETNSGCGLTYSATRTWVVTDGSGYQASCGQTVQVVDTTPPGISCAGDKNVVYGNGWSFDNPSAQDVGAQESVVYDNTANDQESAFSPGSSEVGNEVTLGGTERYVSRFSVGYWGSNTVQEAFAGDVRLRVRFYSNDGPVVSGYASPGTLIYDSGALPIAPTNGGTLLLTEFQLGAKLPLAGTLPGLFTWTAQFSGLSGDDSAGLQLFGPPVTGQVLSNYWENGTQGWVLQTNGTSAGDYAVQIAALDRGVNLTVLSTITNVDCGNSFSAARAWQAVDACGNTSTCTQRVAVVDQGAPMITAQPESQTVLAGVTTNLSVGISACPPLTYQWYFNGDNLANGTDATLVLSNVATTDTGEYSLVVSNPYGSVTSAPALITVVLPPSIVAGPADQTTTNGGSVFFSVTAAGTDPLSYQWYFGTANGLADETNSMLSLSNLTILQAGTYQVVISNAYGSVTSAPAQLTVLAPPNIIANPTDQVTTNGSTVQFVVIADGAPPLAYQWFFNDTNQIPGATQSILSLQAVTANDSGAYSVVVSNAFGSATSQPALLRVLVPPQLLSLTQNQNVVSLTISTVNNLVYSVYYLDDLSTTNWILLPKGGNLPGTGGPITIQDARANGGQRFYRLVVQ
jgi:hypothetical protein